MARHRATKRKLPGSKSGEQKTGQGPAPGHSRRPPREPQPWRGAHVLYGFLAGIILGGAVGFAIGNRTADSAPQDRASPQPLPHSSGSEQSTQPPASEVQTPILPSSRPPTGGMLDAYGRPPGDPHYGHDHQ